MILGQNNSVSFFTQAAQAPIPATDLSLLALARPRRDRRAASCVPQGKKNPVCWGGRSEQRSGFLYRWSLYIPRKHQVIHFNPIFLIHVAISQMKGYNQTGMVMMQGCPKEGGFKGRVRQAENQSKHGISLGCGLVFSVHFRENGLPLDCHGACQIAREAQRKELFFTQFYKAKEILIFLNHTS